MRTNPKIMNVIRAIAEAGVTPSHQMLMPIFADRPAVDQAIKAWRRPGGVKTGYHVRPSAGTKTGAVWAACDLAHEHGCKNVTVKTIKAVTRSLGLSDNTIDTQVSRWRVTNGHGPATTR